MFSLISTFQQDVSSLGVIVDVSTDDLHPTFYNTSGGIGVGMILILLIIIGVVIIILRHRRDHKKASLNNNHKPTDGFKASDCTSSFSAFYVADDGTIIRGQKELTGAAASSVLVKSQNEQKEAISLINESADAGVAEAQYYLGLCYEQGTVVPKDLEVAKKWYRLAASQSYPQAKFRLGKLMMEDKQ